uniref:Beta-1,3-glucanase n=1 Tax=Nepenthes alata TaxID=4376 RepID=I7H3Q7_NEPAL|nr:beta-1,3-glucanase [Nepenthes alata]
MVKTPSMAAVAAVSMLLVLIVPLIQTADARVGVCYGRNGNNLPSEQQVVSLYQSNGIGRMRMYDPDQAALQALKGSNIDLILDVPNDSLRSLASNASQWVQSNVAPFASDVNFTCISVGNEVEPSDSNAQYVLPAMQNVRTALNAANLGRIPVSTAIKFDLLGNSNPPSAGSFNSSAVSYITPIINFLKSNGAPLLANIYPYFSYVDNPQSININYALFTSPGTVVTDTGNGLKYQNLFDAMVDSVYAAVARVGAPNLAVVVSESGWPSDGGTAATVDNASTYIKNLINHVKGGTPRKPRGPLETYLFAMFDENQKPAGVEQHFGLFNPDGTPKYQISFN